jgi:fructuronate reductase
LKLTNKGLKNRKLWEDNGFNLPIFDRAAVAKRTRKAPVWLHIGAGNIFRAQIAMLAQTLLNAGQMDKGIIVAEGYDNEIIDVAYKPYDDLSILVTLKADSNTVKTVVASVVESVRIDIKGIKRMKKIFAAESLQLVSFTITEKGYNLTGADGSLLPEVEADTASAPSLAKSCMGSLAALCYHRYQKNATPIALVSMDNCSRNGDLLHGAIRHFATEWIKRGFCDSGFLSYVDDRSKLSCPWTMIDKITPHPDEYVAVKLRDAGIEDCDVTITGKSTYIAPFVNAEEVEYLVIEDAFPNGRPPLEKAGVLFTDRETVEKTEKMKVCTCLNPLHTALAILGCLLSHVRVSEAIENPLLLKLVRRVADEGLPVVVDPKIISSAEFIDTVINKRLPNPFIPDTLLRITVDTSAKLAVRFGETIKAYKRSDTLNTDMLHAIPLALAGWCRYLIGIDDSGDAFELSYDPVLPELQPMFAGIKLGDDIDCEKLLAPLLSNSVLFGINLYEAGLAKRVEEYFKMMIKKTGAVQETLETVLQKLQSETF